MRTKLKMLRVAQDKSQQQMADAIGCNRSTYADVETGKRYGQQKFWTALQSAFNVPDEDMWEIMKNE